MPAKDAKLLLVEQAAAALEHLLAVDGGDDGGADADSCRARGMRIAKKKMRGWYSKTVSGEGNHDDVEKRKRE